MGGFSLGGNRFGGCWDLHGKSISFKSNCHRQGKILVKTFGGICIGLLLSWTFLFLYFSGLACIPENEFKV